MTAQRSYSFIGQPTGDGECFCWNVEASEHERIRGKRWHEDEVEYRKEGNVPATIPFRFYPGTVLAKLLCQDNKLYKFTITAEEIGEVPKEWLEEEGS